MSALQLTLSYGDGVMFFLNSMGFTERVADKNVIHIDELLQYYGASDDLDISTDNEERVTIITTQLCGLINLSLFSTQKPDGYELCGLFKDTRNHANSTAKREWTRIMAPVKWGKKYQCPILKCPELSSDQIICLVRELSAIKQSCDEWRYFLEAY